MIKRNRKKDLLQSLNRKEITVLTGARQVGKTTLIKEIIRELEAKGEKTLYFNLDIERDMNYFRSQETFLNKLRLELGDAPAYVFIDEIQRKEEAGLFLKGIYDMDLPYKFTVTGSGSLELKQKIGEALTGRKILIYLPPVMFDEFVQYKTAYRYENRLALYFETEKENLALLLNEYLTYGGYPAVVTASTQDDKTGIMQEIFQSYLTKDIAWLLHVKSPDKFVRMMQLLAAQAGGLLRYSDLAHDVTVTVQTLKTYLWYAEQTFMIHTVKPFFTNPKKELTKSPVVYFNDLGMLHFLRGTLPGNLKTGMDFQNFVYLILKERFERPLSPVKYWRTKNKAEVDFVIIRDGQVIPFEVKFSPIKKPVVSRSLRSFIEKYKPPRAYVVHTGDFFETKIETTEVIFLPYWKLYFLEK